MSRRARIALAVVALAALALVIAAAQRPAPAPPQPPKPESSKTQSPINPEQARALAALRALAATHRRDVDERKDTEQLDDDERTRRETEDDPVASLIPLLAGQPPEQQLAYLHWARRLPGDGYIAVFPDLTAGDTAAPERARLARDAIDALVALLEAEGVRAPALPADFQPVRIVDDAPPVPPPPSLLEDYRPHPDDPYRLGGK